MYVSPLLPCCSSLQKVAPQGLNKVQSPELRELIAKCIEHDPSKRKNVFQLVKDPFFDSVRNAANNMPKRLSNGQLNGSTASATVAIPASPSASPRMPIASPTSPLVIQGTWGSANVGANGFGSYSPAVDASPGNRNEYRSPSASSTGNGLVRAGSSNGSGPLANSLMPQLQLPEPALPATTVVPLPVQQSVLTSLVRMDSDVSAATDTSSSFAFSPMAGSQTNGHSRSQDSLGAAAAGAAARQYNQHTPFGSMPEMSVLEVGAEAQHASHSAHQLHQLASASEDGLALGLANGHASGSAGSYLGTASRSHSSDDGADDLAGDVAKHPGSARSSPRAGQLSGSPRSLQQQYLEDIRREYQQAVPEPEQQDSEQQQHGGEEYDDDDDDDLFEPDEAPENNISVQCRRLDHKTMSFSIRFMNLTGGWRCWLGSGVVLGAVASHAADNVLVHACVTPLPALLSCPACKAVVLLQLTQLYTLLHARNPGCSTHSLLTQPRCAPAGPHQRIGFVYDTDTDTAEELANEMTETLSLNPDQVATIRTKIEGQLYKWGSGTIADS